MTSNTRQGRAMTMRVLLQAEPEPLEIDLQATAVIVVDMQNAFLSKGGMVDLRGADISKPRAAMQPIKRITGAARAKGLKVIYIAHRYSPDMRESGGPNSPAWHKSDQKSYREHPEWRDRHLITGTWGAEIVEELKPQEGDILVVKPRYSAFFRTNLDIILNTFNIRYLAFTGVTTNTCVETSIRDAFHLGYFPILISDACGTPNPSFVQDATVDNVKGAFGWVTTSESIIKSMAF